MTAAADCRFPPPRFLSAAELDAISRLARDSSAPGRLRLVEIAADLLAATLGEAERALVGDVLQRLVAKAQGDLRQLVSNRLAANPQAPHALIVFLANDEIAVARPVLLRSDVLTDPDLVHIIRNRSIFHSRSIAMRPTLSEVVGETLVETGDRESMGFLLRNAGARISAAAALSLAAAARTIEILQAPLLHRPEMSPEAAAVVYWHVPEELRRHIRSRFGYDAPGADGDAKKTETRPPRLAYKNGGWTVE